MAKKKKVDYITKAATKAFPQTKEIIEEAPQEEVGSLLRLIRREKQKLSLAGRKIQVVEIPNEEIKKATQKIFTPDQKEEI